MRVQLRTTQRLEVRGEVREYKPGHVVDVTRNLAEVWVARGSAVMLSDVLLQIPAGSGILSLSSSAFLDHLVQDGMAITVGDLGLPYTYTMIVTTPLDIGFWTMLRGYACLDKWDMAIPIKDYTKTYATEATGMDVEWGESALGHLAVPLMDTRLMWMRKTPATEALIEDWRREPGKREFAFMRCLYRRPMAVNVLPKL